MAVSIWDFVADKVKNKGFLDRVWHSARFHSVRSATKSPGSFGSKLLGGLGAIGRASFNLIPIPVFKDVLGQIEGAIEKKARAYFHRHRRAGAQSAYEEVKFDLKEISVENLDRYRFKVNDSWTELKEYVPIYSAEAANAAAAGSQCVAQLSLAMKVAQAERRLEIFEREVAGLLVILESSKSWAASVRTSVTAVKNTANTDIAAASAGEAALLNAAVTAGDKLVAANEIKSRHINCCSSTFTTDFCSQREAVINSNWDKFRAGAAAVTRELQEPFSAESFLSMDRTNFENADRVGNYGSAPPK
jgi:hypothetical protein